METIDVIIEIPRGSRVKYEANPVTGHLRVDRFLYGSHAYFFNYGYISNTLSGDGDPLDVVVLCEESLPSLSIIECRPVAVLFTTDEKGTDEKIICVPCDRVDPTSSHILDLPDLNSNTVKKLVSFFEDYKKGEKGKWSTVSSIGHATVAWDVIEKSRLNSGTGSDTA